MGEPFREAGLGEERDGLDLEVRLTRRRKRGRELVVEIRREGCVEYKWFVDVLQSTERCFEVSGASQEQKRRETKGKEGSFSSPRRSPPPLRRRLLISIHSSSDRERGAQRLRAQDIFSFRTLEKEASSSLEGRETEAPKSKGPLC